MNSFIIILCGLLILDQTIATNVDVDVNVILDQKIATNVDVDVKVDVDGDEKKGDEKKETMPETDTVLSHDDLRRLFEDDDSSAFYSEISKQLGDDAPSLEDLSEMFNTRNDGTMPDYITDNGLILQTNHSGSFGSSNPHNGSYINIFYGLMQSDGTTGNYSSVAFKFFQGTEGNISYAAGVAYFGRVGYHFKDDKSYVWRGSTVGVLLHGTSTGKFVAYGNYTGVTQGDGSSISSAEHKGLLNTLGIFNTDPYHSKTVTNITIRLQPGSSSYTADTFSITGGSSVTISSSGTIPAEGNEIWHTVNETFVHSDNQTTTFNYTGGGYMLTDTVDLNSENNLPIFFNGMYV